FLFFFLKKPVPFLNKIKIKGGGGPHGAAPPLFLWGFLLAFVSRSCADAKSGGTVSDAAAYA
ncbi:MAG: hypothetical protein SOV54_05500, partial [Faecalibacterium prausnitzii]|nr:hypothetical protein [Faecalibacterium prausnitzii]